MMFVIGVVTYIVGKIVFGFYGAIGLALMLAGILNVLAACLDIAWEDLP